MPTFYYKDKMVVADKLSSAKQTFEFIFKTKIVKSEIFDHDVEKTKKLESELIEHDNGYIIPFKNGSYYFKHRTEFNPEGTFDISKAKVYKNKTKAIALLENLYWIRDHFVNKEISVDEDKFSLLDII